MEIIQELGGPRGTIVFDEYERNAYVCRLLEVFNTGLTEEELCSRAYAIHLEICTRADLYIAVADRLSSRQRSAMHWYSTCKGRYQPKPKYEVEQ